jgi:hypothetical protein
VIYKVYKPKSATPGFTTRFCVDELKYMNAGKLDELCKTIAVKFGLHSASTIG